MAQGNVLLRLEAENGSPTQEYRVDEGKVEVRVWRSPSGYGPPESSWHRLTPQQLRTHVERNTAVAQWLQHRLGWRRVLQACQESQRWRTAEERVDRNAA